MLEVVRGPNVGFHGISMATAYDFSVGAVYETHTFASAPPNNNYHRYTILSRTDFTDRIEYSVQEEHQVLNIMGPPPYTYIFNYDTTIHTRFKAPWLDETGFNIATTDRYYYDTSLFDCTGLNVRSYEKKINQCLSECPGTTCIGYGDCFMLSKYEYKYTEQMGTIRSQSEMITSLGSIGYEELIYIHNGAIECGEMSLGVKSVLPNAEDIKLYPNPAGGSVTLQTGSLQGLINNVYIADVTGKKLSPVMSANGSNIHIDLLGIQPGTYWIAIETTGGTLSKKLVIVR